MSYTRLDMGGHPVECFDDLFEFMDNLPVRLMRYVGPVADRFDRLCSGVEQFVKGYFDVVADFRYFSISVRPRDICHGVTEN
ncbi:MAG TPA: hypothetical protein VJK51_02885 [Candidatus Nanoarchaeia archaeon]|nr:hypothetical protein [Candidatus Nanoarchaeia archaeon]